ncbi:MAG: response regulator, partial [Planctomycetota bacterium]
PPEPCDAAAACDEALAELGPAIEARGARVRREALPWVQADSHQLRWLFTLAIENAIDHGSALERPARVTISAWHEGERVCFAVRDHGPGIAAERREEAFVLFRRLERGSGDDTGIGAGLALARRIVRRHGGAIGFAAVEHGAELRFDLRAAALADAAKELRVLHIDDNPADRRLTEIALQRNGVSVEGAASLTAGIARLARPGIAAVLLDLGLPECQGLDCLERLRAAEVVLPVLVMSGCDDPERMAAARAAGASDYLVKGELDGAGLRAAIVRAIGHRV